MKPRDLQELKAKVLKQLVEQVNQYERKNGIRKGDTIELILKIKVK